jgi:hypothetical protein
MTHTVEQRLMKLRSATRDMCIRALIMSPRNGVCPTVNTANDNVNGERR